MPYKNLKIACIILASGNSERFGKSKSKLFYKVHGTTIIELTLKNILKHINKNSIYITIPKKITKNEKKLISKYSGNELISGGKTRFDSLKKALKKIERDKYNMLMIHDAARPILSKKMIREMLDGMNTLKYDCSVPASVVQDTLRKKNKTIKRENIRFIKHHKYSSQNILEKN